MNKTTNNYKANNRRPITQALEVDRMTPVQHTLTGNWRNVDSALILEAAIYNKGQQEGWRSPKEKAWWQKEHRVWLNNPLKWLGQI